MDLKWDDTGMRWYKELGHSGGLPQAGGVEWAYSSTGTRWYKEYGGFAGICSPVGTIADLEQFKMFSSYSRAFCHTNFPCPLQFLRGLIQNESICGNGDYNLMW